MIDTHCHLTYNGLIERADQVVAAAHAAGVQAMVTVGTSPDDAHGAVALAERFPSLFTAVGLHPNYAQHWPDRAAVVETLRQLAVHPKVVALGEMGLDRHYPDPPQDLQRRALEWQLQLAADLAPAKELALIIHNREATADTLAILRASGIPGGRFVFHCFTGSDAELDAILGFGAMVGFTGIVTFKNARGLAASAARVPPDRLLLETDSPYLTPEPYRKIKINEPRYVTEVARFLAGQRGVAECALAAQTTANARRFFHLPS
jgi:TatD DNase family protein